MTNIPELRRMHGAATQEEWDADEFSRILHVGLSNDIASCHFADKAQCNDDAAAIVALHNAAPALFDAADRLARVEAVLASDEAVERVARAMYEAVNRSPTCWSWDDSGLDDEHPGARQRFESKARVAIAALAGLVGEG